MTTHLARASLRRCAASRARPRVCPCVCPRSRRGFAMPLVLLLLLVVGMVAAVMLRRADAQGRSVQRQTQAYQTYHTVRGLQSTLEAWIQTKNANEIDELVDDDGFVMRFDPSDGTVVEVYLFDGQGTMRSTLDSIPSEQRDHVLLALESLVLEFGQNALLDYAREVGPWQVSIAAAPEPVLRALCEAAGESEGTNRLADAIIEEMELSGSISREGLGRAMNRVDLEAEERARFNAVVTVTPTLWEVVMDVRGTGVNAGLGLLGRYRSLAIFRPPGSITGTAFERPPPFLTWQEDTDRSLYSDTPASAPALAPPPRPSVEPAVDFETLSRSRGRT